MPGPVDAIFWKFLRASSTGLIREMDFRGSSYSGREMAHCLPCNQILDAGVEVIMR